MAGQFTPSGPFSRQTWQAIENIPGAILGKTREALRYLGTEKASQDYTRLLRGLPAAAAPAPSRQSGFIGPTQDIYEQPGVGYFDRRSGRFLGRGSTGSQTPVVSGVGPGGQVDRTQSDQYRAALSQYAQTPEGQFQRWFSPEMDPYFGAASRGKGAPKTVEEALTLASGKGVPAGTGIATKYRAESALGQGNIEEIIDAMGYKGTPMEQWARSNQMLAFREFNKRFPAGSPTQGPEAGTLQPAEALKGVTKAWDTAATETPGFVQGFDSTSARTPGFVPGGFDYSSALTASPELKPFTLPGGAFTQGRNVSAPYDPAQAQAAFKINPQNWASQNFPSLNVAAEEFLKNLGAGGSWGQQK